LLELMCVVFGRSGGLIACGEVDGVWVDGCANELVFGGGIQEWIGGTQWSSGALG
jgi:hypothetical protein